MPIGLLAVARQKIPEPRSQIAADVPDDDRDAVRVGVDLFVEIGVGGHLRDRSFAERLVVPEGSNDVLEIRRAVHIVIREFVSRSFAAGGWRCLRKSGRSSRRDRAFRPDSLSRTRTRRTGSPRAT